MGHLFYVELGNKVQFDPNTGYMVDSGLLNKGPFTDLQRNLYWSGTSTGPGFAWVFGFGPNFGSEYDPFFIGFQYQPRNTDGVFALAVHSGNVGVSTVPEPATLWLLGPCLAGLAAMKVFGERNTKFGNTCYVP